MSGSFPRVSTPRLDVPGELLGRCRQGDDDARRQLFDATLPHVRRILFRLAGPRDLDDLSQQAFLEIFRSLDRYQGRGAFSSWVFGICLRVARKRARGLSRFLRFRERWAAEAEDPAPGLDHDAARLERARAVERTLARLPFEQRAVLVMFEMEGQSGGEIALALEIPEPTVWTRLHRARKNFARLYPWPEK